MGTNYYLYNWHGEQVSHLAKTSAGWVPGIQATDYYSTYEGFKEFVNRHGHIVKNEYGEQVDVDTFLTKLERFREENTRRHDRGYTESGFDFVPGEWS